MNAEKYPLLSTVSSVEDLRTLPPDQMKPLAEEIRAFLIENVTKTGGHLASNLGVVELTLALHRVFDTPNDRIVFDVGHQTYVHKIVTGRADRFDTLRTPGGLSGFSTPRESEFDTFVSGHSSNSVSLALGLAEENRRNGSDARTVAVVGDGAFTGGMIHEALNNCRHGLRLVIVLNENRMSISRNGGAFAAYLSRVRVSERYRRSKQKVKNFLHYVPLLGPALAFLIGHIKNFVRKIVHPLNFFEELGLAYIGPVDGNDYKAISGALRRARAFHSPVVVHVSTKKGKGYAPAEAEPDVFHSVSTSEEAKRFHEIFSEELLALAEKDEKCVAVTAAMGIGTGLSTFGKKYPDRYFDVGIAEEHAVTFSAGLAKAGAHPYCVVYSTFLQRAYDSILHDVAIDRLPVRFIVDRAGLAVSDGVTHHGVYDTAYLAGIPGMKVYAPATYDALRDALSAAAQTKTPVAVRYPNATEDPDIVRALYTDGFDAGQSVRCDFDPGAKPDGIFVTYGPYAAQVLDAEAILRDKGLSVGCVLLPVISPVGEFLDTLADILGGAGAVVFAEEGVRGHGVFENTVASLAEAGKVSFPFAVAAIDDPTAIPDAPVDLYEFHGIGKIALAEKMAGLFARDN